MTSSFVRAPAVLLLAVGCSVNDVPPTPDGSIGSDAPSDSSQQADSADTSIKDSSVADTSDAACVGVDFMSDKLNCGSCGHDCLGGGCTKGACDPVTVLLASGVGPIAVDAKRVYYAQGWGANISSVNSVPIGGGSPTALVSNLSWVNHVAVDATDVYFSGYGSNPGSNGFVSSVPLNGGSVTNFALALNYPTGLAINATSVFWCAAYGTTIVSSMKNNTNQTTAASKAPNTNCYIGLDSTRLFVGDTVNTVSSAPIGGGSLTPLSAVELGPGTPVSDGLYVYWANLGTKPNYTDGSIVKAPVGGGKTTTLASNQCWPSGITIDATDVYWVNACAAGDVMRVAKTNGTATSIASKQDHPAWVAVDSTQVFWSSAAGIERVAK